MSGVLDPKTRVFDVFITQEGRRQLATGELRIEYASFSDDDTYYKGDLVSGSDSSTRLYLESCNLPQDLIALEANDSGRLQPFKNVNGIDILNGQIVTQVVNETTGTNMYNDVVSTYTLTGSDFSSQSNELLRSSIDNFKSLRILGSFGDLLDDEEFQLSTNNVTFSINTELPLNVNQNKTSEYITHIDGLLEDQRLSDQQNFQFLPPVIKRGNSLYNVGNYTKKTSSGITYNNLMNELNELRKKGFSKEIRCSRTSLKNNIFCQFFEVTDSEIHKLDVVEFTNMNGNFERIFFVGKVLLDDNGDHTFVNMFTLVFS